jgi:uncharacterized protein
MKTTALIALAVAALAASACGGGDDGAKGPSGSSAAPSGDVAVEASIGGASPSTVQSASAQGITVVGTGSLKSVPDISEWSFGIHSRAETADAALRENAVATKRLLDALKRAGIAKGDLRTEHVSLWPDMSEGGTVVGYAASNSVHATVRKMARAGAIVDTAVGAGANEVWGPSFRISDTRAKFDEAAAAAYDDARRKAETLAANAGVSLGRPTSIVEASGAGVMFDGSRFGAAEAMAADVPIEPGKQEMQVILTVTFAVS